MSDGDLASITGQLDLADHYTFTALEADDLLGLTSVERLFINVNVDQVPLGIFDDLASLRELQIYHNTYGTATTLSSCRTVCSNRSPI